jgi:cation transport protein ChaC
MSKIFAYGSLLNKNTLSFEASIELVILKGWVRQWRQIVPLKQAKICALTISPDSNTSIEGILLKVDKETELSLNKREIGYDKTILNGIDLINQCANVQLNNDDAITYTSSTSTKAWASKEAPILLSYIDVVAKGYYDVFGKQGVIEFFNTTQGWHLPILNDRKKPIYPRATTHDKKFLDFIDQQLLLNLIK